MSRITNSSIYTTIGVNIAETMCLFSQENISANFYERFEVITNVPVVTTFYDTTQFLAYSSMHGTANRKMPDPLRNFPNLDFTLLRFAKVLNATAEEKKTAIGMTDDQALATCLRRWAAFERGPAAHTLMIGLHTFERVGLVYRMDVRQATTFLTGKIPGTYMLRTSSQSSANPANDAATIFTISYVTSRHTVEHIRYLAMHKVGVYRLTDGHRGTLEYAGINAAALPNLQATTVLAALNYRMPHSASIVDELEYLQTHSYIVLGCTLPAQPAQH